MGLSSGSVDTVLPGPSPVCTGNLKRHNLMRRMRSLMYLVTVVSALVGVISALSCAPCQPEQLDNVSVNLREILQSCSISFCCEPEDAYDHL